jgi:hypothetical protein
LADFGPITHLPIFGGFKTICIRKAFNIATYTNTLLLGIKLESQ